jgi:hypothetical protein
MSQNKVNAAIDKYNQAIKLSPNYAEAYVKARFGETNKRRLAGRHRRLREGDPA